MRKRKSGLKDISCEPPADAPPLLLRFPPRSGSERYVYFDELKADVASALRGAGYSPVILSTLPRETEREHKAYLLALSQGMSEGTITADKERLAACDLDMRAHGMLSRYSTGLTDDNKRRRSVEEHLVNWDKGRHAVHQSTIQDPREVERILRQKAGVLDLRPEGKKEKMRKKWTRKTKGDA